MISGINAKDAICLKLTGRTSKSDRHEDARNELTRSGPAGRALAPNLSRLLRMKTRAQYQSGSMAASDATRAIEWATRMLEGAQRVVSA